MAICNSPVRRIARAGALILVLCLVLVVVWDRYGLRPAPPPLDPGGSHVDRIVIEKSARRLTAYRGDAAVLQLDVALGHAPVGDKAREGDGRTPEGVFAVDRRNPASAFHLSLGIDYPRPGDVARAAVDGFDPGGDIFIHGQPNGLADLVTLPGDWTQGCIAVSNTQMDTLWRIVPLGTRVEILP